MGTNDKILDDRFYMNMKRVGDLAKLVSAKSPAAASLDSGVRDDIARAVVVFLHATFEDMLRSTARQRLDSVSIDTLKTIPLAGASGRAEKFNLGALDSHRGKTVDELLRESVAAYWKRATFSSCDEIETALRQMELDTRPFKVLYTGLDAMITRRHQIVHEADLPGIADTELAPWSLADNLLLGYWLIHVLTFYAQLKVTLSPGDELQRWYLGRRTQALERMRSAIQTLLDAVKGFKREEQADIEAFSVVLKLMADELTEVQTLLGSPTQDESEDIARKMTLE
jgi:hypothetical protein